MLGLYTLSFLIVGLLFFIFKKNLLPPIAFIKQAVPQKNSYILAGAVILTSLFFHINFINMFELKSQNKTLEAIFYDWQYGAKINLPNHYILQKGDLKSGIVITEFADFLCPACKKVNPALKQFLSRHPDINFQFYVYPLDGTCNPALKTKGSGLSCKLSRVVICANKQNKGWLAHDFFV